jgi:hypothetical protein
MPNNAPASAARIGAAWPHMIGNLAVLALATLNMLVHSRDARTSVVPGRNESLGRASSPGSQRTSLLNPQFLRPDRCFVRIDGRFKQCRPRRR